MIIINDFLKVSNSKRSSSDLVNLKSFFFLSLILWLQALLVLDEFLFHEKIILDSLLSQ